MAYDTHVTVFAVLIPRQEIHADIINAQFSIMLEKAIDIFTCAGILGHSPVEPLVFGRRVNNRSFMIIIKLSECIAGAFNLGLIGAMDPQRVVIYPNLKPLGLTLSHQGFQFHRTIVGHIA